MPVIRASGALLAASLVAAPQPPSGGIAAQAASAYVTVVNEDGQPVVGLGAEDFAMRDGAVRQAVLGSEAATGPIAAIILPLVRADADAVRTHAAARMFAETLTRADPAHVARELKASPLSAEETASAVAVACAALADAPTDRRAVLLLAPRPLAWISAADADAILGAVTRTRASIWTVEWDGAGPDTGPTTASASTPARRSLDDVLAEAAALGGSIRRVIRRADDLDAASRRVADLLLSQYLVTFMWPNPMLGQLNITTRHDRGTVLMASWR